MKKSKVIGGFLYFLPVGVGLAFLIAIFGKTALIAICVIVFVVACMLSGIYFLNKE